MVIQQEIGGRSGDLSKRRVVFGQGSRLIGEVDLRGPKVSTAGSVLINPLHRASRYIPRARAMVVTIGRLCGVAVTPNAMAVSIIFRA